MIVTTVAIYYSLLNFSCIFKKHNALKIMLCIKNALYNILQIKASKVLLKLLLYPCDHIKEKRKKGGKQIESGRMREQERGKIKTLRAAECAPHAFNRTIMSGALHSL